MDGKLVLIESPRKGLKWPCSGSNVCAGLFWHYGIMVSSYPD